MKIFTKLLIAAAVVASVASPVAWASGFKVNEKSVSGIGRAYAGEAAWTDSAAVLGSNPAAASWFETQTISAAAHYIHPSVAIEGAYQDGVVYTAGTTANQSNVIPDQIVPGFSYILPFADKFAFGVNLNTNFGLETGYDSGFPASIFAGKTKVTTYWLTPSFSWQITEDFSVGAGVSYVYGKQDLTNSYNSPFIGNVGVLNVNGNSDEFGWSAGLLWEVTEGSRLGFSYISGVDMNFDVDVSLNNPVTGAAILPDGSTGIMTVNLPAIAELAYTQDIGERWIFSAGLQFAGWSSFEKLEVADINDGAIPDTLIREENWSDAWRYAVGADYRINEKASIRFGYAFDKGATRENNRTLTIPDTNIDWFTIGGTLQVQKGGNIDLGLAFLHGERLSIQEIRPELGASFDGKLKSSTAIIYSIAYSLSF